ncbi:MAG: LacI family DNA-binding transcriptional regulator [Chthoniobacterales bacterium]
MKSHIRSTTQLANLLGLSRWTVSKALNGHSIVNHETAERIRNTATKYGFSPSIIGRGLRAGKTSLIGICFPPLIEFFLAPKISRLQDAIEARGYHPVMQMTGGSEKEENDALGRFAAMGCAGVFTIASRLEPGAQGMLSLAASQTPVVMIDPVHCSSQKIVSTDRAAGIGLVMEHLHKLGHRQLVTMGIRENSAYGPQRMEGFRKACKTLGWNFKRDIHFITSDQKPDVDDNLESGAIMAKKYLALPGKRVAAIFAINDRVAFATMSILQDAGLQIPKDVSILGCDNAEYSSYIRPALTTLDSQASELIDHAIELLPQTAAVKTKSADGHIVIRPQLIVRDSTGKPPRGL